MIMKKARLETKKAKAKTIDAREIGGGTSEASLNDIEAASQASNTDGRVEGAKKIKGNQAQAREVPVHEPNSDLDHSLPGVGVHGAGRSIGLSGHSLPRPDVLAESGN